MAYQFLVQDLMNLMSMEKSQIPNENGIKHLKFRILKSLEEHFKIKLQQDDE